MEFNCPYCKSNPCKCDELVRKTYPVNYMVIQIYQLIFNRSDKKEILNKVNKLIDSNVKVKCLDCGYECKVVQGYNNPCRNCKGLNTELVEK